MLPRTAKFGVPPESKPFLRRNAGIGEINAITR
jgi:hypothetical protein